MTGNSLEAAAHEAEEGLVFLTGLETPGESLLAGDADKEKSMVCGTQANLAMSKILKTQVLRLG